MNRSYPLFATAVPLVLAWIASGCGGESFAPTDVLYVAAASDLQNVLPELVRRFPQNDHQRVQVTFGSSGKLAEQIRAGARFDVFLAANESYVKALADEKLVKRESVRPYAIGSLVMAVRRDATVTIGSVSDLTSPGVKRVAIANPDFAPYGAAARQALKKAGVWDELGPKLVLADSVGQAFLFAETGNADVALVGRALTRGSDVRVVEVDPRLYDTIVQSLGVVLPGPRDRDPEAFTRFVTGPEGRSVLESYGFKVPPAATP